MPKPWNKKKLKKGSPKNTTKYSEALMELAADFLEHCDTLEEFEKLATIAMISWNLSLETQQTIAELVEDYTSNVLECESPEEAESISSIIYHMIDLKKILYPDDLTHIADIKARDNGDEFRLQVAHVRGV